MSLPLKGVKVLDMAQAYAAPGGAMYLADLGADIIKIEQIGGDRVREPHQWPIKGETIGRPFLVLNRNKRGIALNLRRDEGKEIARKLIEKSDVLVINFRSGDERKYGLDYESISKVNPRIVYAHLTGWGDHGPMAHWPANDLLVQARSGVMAANKDLDGRPQICAVMPADVPAGMILSCGIVAALFEREKTGKGAKVDLSLMDVVIATQLSYLINIRNSPNPPSAIGTNPLYRPFKCKDGKYIIFMIASDRAWSKACEILDRKELQEDPRFDTQIQRLERAEELRAVIEPVLSTRPREEWLRKLADCEDISWAPVLTRDEVFNEPQFRKMEMFETMEDPRVGTVDMMAVPIRYNGVRERVRRPAPDVGEHTAEILKEIGYSSSQIQKFFAEGIAG